MEKTQKSIEKSELEVNKNLMVTHLSGFSCICVHDKTGIVATGSSEIFIRIWNARSRQQVRVFEEIMPIISNLLITQQGNRLFSTSGNGKPLSWLTARELNTGTVLKCKFFYGKILKISFIKAESELVVGVSDSEISILDTDNFETRNSLNACFSMKLLISSPSYIVAGGEKGFKTWSISNPAYSSRIPAKVADSTLASVVEDTVIWTYDTEILYLDLNTKQEGQLNFHEYRIVAITACGRKVASASSDCLVVLWDFALKSCVFKVKTGAVATNLAVLGESNEVVCTDVYRSLCVVSESGSFEFAGHKLEITCWGVSRDGSIIATGARDCSVRIWDLASITELSVIKAHILTVTCVCFSFLDRFLVSGSIDCNIISWDLKNKCINHVFTHHAIKILRIIGFKTTQKILVLDKDGSVSLIDLNTKDFVFLQNVVNATKFSLTLTNNEKLCIISVNNLQTKVLKLDKA